MTIKNVVLVHGWGLNKAIWSSYADSLREHLPEIKVHLLDIPGYGEMAHKPSSSNIRVLAQQCLSQAPEQALWVGWSLGGMIAMQAAILDQEQSSNRVQALQLINAAPKFIASTDWPSGVDIAIFRKFCDSLASDYEKTLGQFLLLQAGKTTDARKLAREAQVKMGEYDNPSQNTLEQGIECLAAIDLREELAALSLPVQVVCGTLDRVAMPETCRASAQLLSAELVEMQCGHAPFLTHPDVLIERFVSFIEQLKLQKEASLAV